MEPISLQFQYTEADYQEFLRNYFWKNRSRLYIGLIFFALLVLGIINRDQLHSIYFLVSTVLPVTILVGLWFLILQHSGRKAFQMTPQMQDPRDCRIDQVEIALTGATFSSDFEWAGVQEVVETQNLYLLYNSKQSAVILPKRVFSGAQTNAFRRIVSQQPGLRVSWKG